MRVLGSVNLGEGGKIKNLTVNCGTAYPAEPSVGEMFYHLTEGLAIYVDRWTPLLTSLSVSGAVSGSLTRGTGGAATLNISLSETGIQPGVYRAITFDKFGRATAGLTTVDWSTISGVPAILPNLALSVQVPAMSGTSRIPYDDTPPLITEGTQIASVTCSPYSTDSKMSIFGSILVSSGTAARNMTLAAFRGNTCIGATSIYLATAAKPCPLPFSFVDTATGSSYGSSVAYSLRVGINQSATWYVNRTQPTALNSFMEKNSSFFLEYI